jgi:hypothetical protein
MNIFVGYVHHENSLGAGMNQTSEATELVLCILEVTLDRNVLVLTLLCRSR